MKKLIVKMCSKNRKQRRVIKKACLGRVLQVEKEPVMGNEHEPGHSDMAHSTVQRPWGRKSLVSLRTYGSVWLEGVVAGKLLGMR